MKRQEYNKERRRKKLERELARLEQRELERIHKGRTNGSGAFNRDVDNIVHQIRLVQRDLECLDSDFE